MRFTIRLGISLLSLFGSSASISSPPPSKRQQQQQVVIMAYNNNNPLPSTLLSYDAQLALDVAQNGDFGHDNVQISDDALRIHWTLDAPSLETAFTVVDHGNLLDPRDMPEPYFLGSDDQGKPKWHRYAASPFTTKPVASVRPAVDPLDNWEAFWEATHRVHYDPDWERSKEEPPVQICCGVARPTGKGSEVVVQGTGAPGGFVTVHDFLTTMHAYLMSRREDILEAMHMDLLRKRLGSEDIGSDTKLIVTPMTLMGVPSITVSTEKEWTRFNRENTTYKGSGTTGIQVGMVTVSGGAPARMPHPLPALDFRLWKTSRHSQESFWKNNEVARVRQEARRAEQEREGSALPVEDGGSAS